MVKAAEGAYNCFAMVKAVEGANIMFVMVEDVEGAYIVFMSWLKLQRGLTLCLCHG